MEKELQCFLGRNRPVTLSVVIASRSYIYIILVAFLFTTYILKFVFVQYFSRNMFLSDALIDVQTEHCRYVSATVKGNKQ